MKTSPTAHFGHSPYLSSRILGFVGELAAKTGKGPDDFLFIEPYSIGDAVHTLGLLPAFRAAYCRDDQRIILLCQERALPLAAVMPYADTVFSAPLGAHELALEYVASLSTVLTPQLPIVCAPDMHAFGRVGRAASDMLAAKRSVLHLRRDDPFTPPVVGGELRGEVEARMRALGMVPGRSLILFPHALSVNDPGPDFWSAIVDAVRRVRTDLAIFSDVTTGAAPTAGTKPISLELPEIVPACEFAGHAVLLRSGLVDLLAHARATVVSVVPPKALYRFLPHTMEASDLFLSKLFPATTVADVALAGQDAGAMVAAARAVAGHMRTSDALAA